MFSIGTIKAMNAKEALAKARSVQGAIPDVGSIVSAISDEISSAAARGNTTVLSRLIPSDEKERKAVCAKLKELGFKVDKNWISWEQTARKRGRK